MTCLALLPGSPGCCLCVVSFPRTHARLVPERRELAGQCVSNHTGSQYCVFHGVYPLYLPIMGDAVDRLWRQS